jgi:hypothetical protein
MDPLQTSFVSVFREPPTRESPRVCIRLLVYARMRRAASRITYAHVTAANPMAHAFRAAATIFYVDFT